MPNIMSLDDLDHVRSVARRSLRARIGVGAVITVHVGECGLAAGARETLLAIVDELQQRGLDARVAIADCVGRCNCEPLVDIQLAESPSVSYGNVRPDMVSRLIESHVENGQPVSEWVVGRQGCG